MEYIMYLPAILLEFYNNFQIPAILKLLLAMFTPGLVSIVFGASFFFIKNKIIKNICMVIAIIALLIQIIISPMILMVIIMGIAG